jgi:hypothetical protein
MKTPERDSRGPSAGHANALVRRRPGEHQERRNGGAAHSGDSDVRAKALARWENEGGRVAATDREPPRTG